MPVIRRFANRERYVKIWGHEDMRSYPDMLRQKRFADMYSIHSTKAVKLEMAVQPRCTADTAGAVSTWVRFTRQTAVAFVRLYARQLHSRSDRFSSFFHNPTAAPRSLPGTCLVPAAGSRTTPASGAADSRALGGTQKALIV